MIREFAVLGFFLTVPDAAWAQQAPTPAELVAYRDLHAAAATGAIDVIYHLAFMGWDVDKRDGKGRTPLHVASFNGQVAAAQQLLISDADPSLTDKQGFDALTIAAGRDDLEMLRVLLSAGADADAVTGPTGGSALIVAARAGHERIVRHLLMAGARVDHTDRDGRTALTEAVISGQDTPRHVATIETLIKAGARIDIADGSGITPLIHAERTGSTRIASAIKAVQRP